MILLKNFWMIYTPPIKKYKIRRTTEFRDQYKLLTSLHEKIDNKIKLVAANPTSIGNPKRGNLRYTRGTHVAGNFVILYMVLENEIIFLNVDRHDAAYKETPRILGNIEREFPELWDVMPPDLKRHLKRGS